MNKSSKTYIAVPPGETIREMLEDRHMSQKEFSHRLGMSEKHISNLINGKIRLTDEVATRLEYVLGPPAEFWRRREEIYRRKLNLVEEENQIEPEQSIARLVPYSKMANLGWVPPTRNVSEKVKNLRSFFEVASLCLLEKKPGLAFRKVGDGINTDYALVAWAQKAKLEARYMPVSSINIIGLKKRINDIRRMCLDAPEVFSDVLRDFLAQYGVSLVYLPHISGTYLHGATFLDNDRIVMGLTVRGRDADKFWFSLFHEIYHIIDGHIYCADGTNALQEESANAFARDILIPPKEYEAFLSCGDFKESDIIRFAQNLGIIPGIVVGRLQKEGYIPFSHHNNLKQQYTIN